MAAGGYSFDLIDRPVSDLAWCCRIVAVATLEFTMSGLSPSKLTPEKRLLGMSIYEFYIGAKLTD